MYVVFVTVKVKPGFEEAFIAATRPNHAGTVGESGGYRFDVLQDASDPATFYLYEVYADEAASRAHKDTAHYKAWREAVSDWMAEPRTAVKAHGLLPSEASSW